MIKFILIGGGDLDNFVLNRIRKEAASHINKENTQINSLVVPFARDEADWNGVFERAKEKYSNPDYLYNHSMASADALKFRDQLKRADEIILTGGSELNLMNYIGHLSLLDLAEKTVIATSAGVNYLSKKYFSNDRQEVANGCGVLDLNTMCHFDITKHEKLEELVKSNGLPTLALKEGEFVVLYE